MKDLREWRQKQERVLWWSKAALLLMVLFVVAFLYNAKFRSLRRMWPVSVECVLCFHVLCCVCVCVCGVYVNKYIYCMCI